jgi:hypothetical protein
MVWRWDVLRKPKVRGQENNTHEQEIFFKGVVLIGL